MFNLLLQFECEVVCAETFQMECSYHNTTERIFGSFEIIVILECFPIPFKCIRILFKTVVSDLQKSNPLVPCQVFSPKCTF